MNSRRTCKSATPFPLLLLLVQLSCIDFTKPVTSGLVSGRYALRAVEGAGLPYLAGTAVIDSGAFEVGSRDTVVLRETYRTPGSGDQPETVVTRVGVYRMDRAESGVLYGINVSPLPGMSAPVFEVHSDSVFVFIGAGAPTPMRLYVR